MIKLKRNPKDPKITVEKFQAINKAKKQIEVQEDK